MKDQVPEEKDMSGVESEPAAELLTDLTFEPDWARRDPAAAPRRFEREERPVRREGRRPGPGRERRGDRNSAERGNRPDRRRAERPAAPRGENRGFSSEPRPASAERPPRRRDDRGPQGFRPSAPPPLPLDIYFLPDQERLAAVVHELHESRRAYSLVDLANRFMAVPALFRVKIEVRKNPARQDRAPASNADKGVEPPAPLWQCKLCRTCASDEATLRAHFTAAHLEEFFEVREVEMEPVTGNFVCLARCGFSGELIAPPNHHSYAAQVLEIQQRCRPGMPLDKYKERIEMIKDPELIEQWRNQSRVRTEYRLKKTPEGEEPQAWTRAQAEEWLEAHETGRRVVQVARVVMGGVQIETIPDARLRAQVQAALQKERHFPFTLMIALRAACRHMKLFLFKAGKVNFVSSIQPVRLSDEKVANEILEIMEYLKAHRGRTRHELIETLRPGALAEGPDAVAALITELAWLLERGHLIEFFDGSIALPGQSFKPRKNSDADRPLPAMPVKEEAGEKAEGGGLKPEGEEKAEGGGLKPEGEEKVEGGWLKPEGGEKVEGGWLKPEGEEKAEGGGLKPEGEEKVEGGGLKPEGEEKVEGGGLKPEGEEKVEGGGLKPEGDEVR